MTVTYETKDSGEHAMYDSGMLREVQTGKPRFDLMIAECVPYEEQMLTRFAELLARGAEKYADRNWEKADSLAELERMKASAFRHFMQWFAGETDEDHAASVWFNILAYESTAYKMGQEPAPEVETYEIKAGSGKTVREIQVILGHATEEGYVLLDTWDEWWVWTENDEWVGLDSGDRVRGFDRGALWIYQEYGISTKPRIE